MTIYDLVANRRYQNKHVLNKLIEHHACIPYKEVIIHYEDNIGEDYVKKIDSDYRKYDKEKVPLEYILGHVDFLGNEFLIDRRAMIPRPETEYMIEAVVEGIRDTVSETGNIEFDILDLGCGCGVLGLSVGLVLSAKGAADYQVPSSISFWDISPEAISLTQQNISHYYAHLEGILLDTCVSNGLQGLMHKPELRQRWIKNNLIIVCNYPYIPDETFEDNADECAKKREPRLAFLGGKDGLDLYRILFGEIEQFGLTHAVLYLEMMTSQLADLNAQFAGDNGGRRTFQIIKTFHFNIIIVRATFLSN